MDAVLATFVACCFTRLDEAFDFLLLALGAWGKATVSAYHGPSMARDEQSRYPSTAHN
jgi:hypothetical protein